MLLPGVVAGFVPWRFFGIAEAVHAPASPLKVLGMSVTLVGVALLVVCIWEFARSGRGTLSPADPPRELVVRGLYRYVRNPMYLSVSVTLLGEALFAGSRSLVIYWAIWFAVVNLFVMGYEEPELKRRFGDGYRGYAERVGRWLPRLRAHRATD